MEWEYRVDWIAAIDFETAVALDRFGAEGWEIAAAMREEHALPGATRTIGGYRVVFKRPRRDVSSD
jgi:hypothetical protein